MWVSRHTKHRLHHVITYRILGCTRVPLLDNYRRENFAYSLAVLLWPIQLGRHVGSLDLETAEVICTLVVPFLVVGIDTVDPATGFFLYEAGIASTWRVHRLIWRNWVCAHQKWILHWDSKIDEVLLPEWRQLRAHISDAIITCSFDFLWARSVVIFYFDKWRALVR